MVYRRRMRRTSRKRKSRTTRRRMTRRRRSMHGGDADHSENYEPFTPSPPSLPPLRAPYLRSNWKKPILPPIGQRAQQRQTFGSSIPDWRERRPTFIENVGRKHREMSGQFHYPKRKLTPWEKIKGLFVKDSRPWPPVFQ